MSDPIADIQLMPVPRDTKGIPRWGQENFRKLQDAYGSILGYVLALNDSLLTHEHPLTGLAVKTSSTTRVSTTTLANDPDLILPVEAGMSYLIDLMVIDVHESAPDFKFGFSGPVGASMYWYYDYHGDVIDHTETNELTLASSASIVEVTRTYKLTANGVLVVGGTAGSVAFQWAQNTSSPTDSTVRRASYLKAVPVV